MNKTTQALQMAIDVLELEEASYYETQPMFKALNACKEALESQEIGDAEIKQMLDDIEYYQKEVEKLKADVETYRKIADEYASQEQEPYGWMFRYVFESSNTCTEWKFTFTPVDPHPTIETMAVYTHPAQSLSDDEIEEMADEVWKKNTAFDIDIIEFARAIEQAHGIGVKDE